MNLKPIKPTASYQLLFPEDIQEKAEGRVSSFWIDGEPVLLQISSYIRHEGHPTPASHRLADRMSKQHANWTIWGKPLADDPIVDQAVAEFTDYDGFLWIHSYFVWAHLTVYATISGPTDVVRDPANWAIHALRAISLNAQ